MTTFERIIEINNQCMRNIDMLMQDSKKSLKSFKMQQADIMKNIMINNDESGALEQQFKTFQADLAKKEQEQYSQISGRIGQEIDNMKHLIMQELSSPSLGMPTSSFGDYQSSFSNTPSAPVPSTRTADADSYNNNATPNVDTNNYSNSTPNFDSNTFGYNQQQNKNVENELNSFLNEGSSTMDMNQMMNTPPSSQQNDIPVETKELDEWISEIKNLI